MNMNKVNFKSIINTNRTNRNTKNITTNNNYDLTSTINLNSKKAASKNKKNLELKTKFERVEKHDSSMTNNPFNTISSTATPNFVKSNNSGDKTQGSNDKMSSFRPKHKKTSSEVPSSYTNVDMLIDSKLIQHLKYNEANDNTFSEVNLTNLI
jgi:hypothetical protein